MSASGLEIASVAEHSVSGVRPGDLFLALLRRCRLSRREQAIVITVLLAPAPLTAREIARKTRLAYSHGKAVIRTLVDWQILMRTPEGLVFQRDSDRRGPPAVPPHDDEIGALLEDVASEADLGEDAKLNARTDPKGAWR